MDDAGLTVAYLDAPEVDTLEHLLALKDGDAFVAADRYGDIGGGADGLFLGDSRRLSRFVLKVGGVRPSLLRSGASRDNVYFTSHATNRALPPMGGKATPPGVIHIERRRFLHQERLYERIRLMNHGMDEAMAPVTVEFDADFRDIFEVRGAHRRERGKALAPAIDGRSATFAYEGLDRALRTSRIAFSEPPARLTAQRAEFMVSLVPGRSFELYVEVGAETSACPTRQDWRAAACLARRRMRSRRRGARIRGRRSPIFNAWLDQSRADVAMLTTDLPTGPYPYAGIPWFATPFGRDGILTAWALLWLDPSLARGVLAYLASRQATEVSAFRDSAPGKIMHETRRGEMADLGEVPFGLYYGGVDTTPLFVALAGAYARRTGDLAFLRTIWPNLQAAGRWLTDYGDTNGDGLIDYARGAKTGLANQGWKDSEDSIFHADGRFPPGPIALVEVQAYAARAYQTLADLAERLGEGEVEGWATRASTLRAAIEDRFWMEDEGFYGVAIDGRGELCRTLTSNAGHLLFMGVAEESRGRRVAQRLMSGAFNSGWGVRTVAEGQARYNPMSYHNGSVWPHDSAICAAGAARYGLRSEVAKLTGRLRMAAAGFDMRLPELFCGFPREAGEPPIAYPLACIPQAWAAASVFLLLQASLGVEIDAFRGEIILDEPMLPAGIDEIAIQGLQVADARLDLVLERVGGGVRATSPTDGHGLRLCSGPR